MLRLYCGALLVGVALIFAGCMDSHKKHHVAVAKEPPVPHTHIEPSLQAGIKPGSRPTTTVVLNQGFDPSTQVAQASDTLTPPGQTAPAPTAYADTAGLTDGINVDQDRAAVRLAGEIAEALKVRKTLVVWVIDRTSAAADVRSWMVGKIPQIGKWATEHGKPTSTLSMAVVSFGSQVDFLNQDLVDATQAANLAGTVSADDEKSPLTFTAVNQAADKFLPFRNQGYEMLMVIVANTTGHDWDQLDAAIPKLRKKAVPVFGVGNAVPFYRQCGTPSN